MRRKSLPLLYVVFALSLLCVLSVAPQSSENRQRSVAPLPPRAPMIRAATVLEDLLKRENDRPRLSPRALAAYGNALLREQGFNYSFDACDILKANGKDGESNTRPTWAELTTPGMITSRTCVSSRAARPTSSSSRGRVRKNAVGLKGRAAHELSNSLQVFFRLVLLSVGRCGEAYARLGGGLFVRVQVVRALALRADSEDA